MYHLGVMQVLIRIIAKAMQATMGTSATESMVAAGKDLYESVFYNVKCASGAPLVIKIEEQYGETCRSLLKYKYFKTACY